MDYQGSIFGFQKPRVKVPISAERIREAKEQIARGDGKGAEQTLRELREGLERFERRLTNKKDDR